MWSIIAAVFGKALAMEFFHRRDEKKRLLRARLDERDAKQAAKPRPVQYLLPDGRKPCTVWRDGGIDGLTNAGDIRAN
jgi:hypothetical protein